MSDWNEFAARNTARIAADQAEEQERDLLRAKLAAATQRIQELQATLAAVPVESIVAAIVQVTDDHRQHARIVRDWLDKRMAVQP